MAKLYLPNVIAEAALTEIVLLQNLSRRSGFVLATEDDIRSAVRGAVERVLGDDAWVAIDYETRWAACVASELAPTEGS